MGKRPEIRSARSARCRRCSLAVAVDAEVCRNCGALHPAEGAPTPADWVLFVSCGILSVWLPVIAWIGG